MQKIKCLECGKYFIKPMTHVYLTHHLFARDYKKLHGLDVKRGIVTKEYREKIREHTITNGTIQNLKKGVTTRFKKGEKHLYSRSQQTIERLRTHWIKNLNKSGDEHWKKQRAAWRTIPCEICGKEKNYTKNYIESKKQKHFYCSCRCATIGKNRKAGTSTL